MTVAAPQADHAAAMDAMYRTQRHFYDATRKYYLFGRDRMIRSLALEHGGAVLEIACGTGRNLARIARTWPGVELYGLDISAEMLKTAGRTLGDEVSLSQGDATGFDAQALFGREKFDRVILSFATSMIPDWQAALKQASALLAKGGSLHVVDFGDMRGMPAPVRWALRSWLTHFQVTPRLTLGEYATAEAARRRMRIRTRRGPMGYYQLVTIESRGTAAH
jgi:S-adenosylmethionine-diacylgycerolhomoserine-N-methlytransferase